MIAGGRLLVPSFRVCVVVVTLSVLLTLAVMLPTRMAGSTPVFLVVVLARPCFIFAAVSGHAFLPTTGRRAVVAERSEVGA